jgi:hypothetical protein
MYHIEDNELKALLALRDAVLNPRGLGKKYSAGQTYYKSVMDNLKRLAIKAAKLDENYNGKLVLTFDDEVISLSKPTVGDKE